MNFNQSIQKIAEQCWNQRLKEKRKIFCTFCEIELAYKPSKTPFSDFVFSFFADKWQQADKLDSVISLKSDGILFLPKLDSTIFDNSFENFKSLILVISNNDVLNEIDINFFKTQGTLETQYFYLIEGYRDRILKALANHYLAPAGYIYQIDNAKTT
ncbi:MAG: hypothetical protein F6J93_40005 [Oscillatoria sp. SIO1A7]|nr:hypothetical protein [Oscillatoria sp. SIO1A7]